MINLPAPQPRQKLTNPATFLMTALIIVGMAAACSQDPAVNKKADTPAPTAVSAPEAETALTVSASQIDWPSARRDFASQQGEQDDENVFTVQSNGARAPVPILLPGTDTVTVQSTGQPGFRLLDDGYYASYPGERYDIIINGTNLVAGDAGEARSDRDGQQSFSVTIGGAQVALSRYGADYLIEFECNVIDDATGSCIDEEEALRIANELIVVGTQ